MSILDIVRQVRWHLEENGRVSCAMLRRELGLDDDATSRASSCETPQS